MNHGERLNRIEQRVLPRPPRPLDPRLLAKVQARLDGDPLAAELADALARRLQRTGPEQARSVRDVEARLDSDPVMSGWADELAVKLFGN